MIIRLFSPVCWALPGWPLVGHLGNIIFYNTMWVAHACILSMLLFCGDHLSLQGVQRVRWMLAPSCCAWRRSCGGHYRYRPCDFPSWLPLKNGNHDSYFLGAASVCLVRHFLCFFGAAGWGTPLLISFCWRVSKQYPAPRGGCFQCCAWRCFVLPCGPGAWLWGYAMCSILFARPA